MQNELQTYNLAEVTDQFLIEKGVRNKKYYAGYLNAARLSWRDLFKNTIYTVLSEWQPLRKGLPYNYIDVPKNMQRLFTVCLTNHCGDMVPLLYNNKVNIIQQPKVNKCGCTACSCTGELCEDIGGLTKITKLIFTIAGVDYFETIWLKLCPNGDILEYRSVPTKKYNDFVGDGGDYSNDYSNDYLKENPPFTDYTIVYQEFQKVLCNLDIKPCGCPENTTTNEEIFLQHCGMYCSPFAHCLRKKELCTKVFENPNYNLCLGSIKLSECGTRIYYIPHPTFKNQPNPKLPEYLLINYQTSGEDCSSMVQVPEFALNAMFYGIDYRTSRFNNIYNFKEKQAKRELYRASQNDLILYLSPFNLQVLSNVQDIPIIF